MRTVISIGTDLPSSGSKRRKEKDLKKELQEIIARIGDVKHDLAGLALDYDADDLDTSGLDEALDALDDAAELLEETLDEEE